MLRRPDFLIIGGMRCGTTSLHELLRLQPDLYLPPKKELHFFDKRNPDLGSSVAKYEKLFASCPSERLCGEATPDYLTTEGCDGFIRQVIPSAKLVILLRDPVVRAWSHYRFSSYKKVETLDFRAALDKETERLEIKSNHSDIFFSYLQRSRYIEHIVRFESLFERSQMKVLFFEELVKDTRETLSELLAFLGLTDTRPGGRLPHLNKVGRARTALGGISTLVDSVLLQNRNVPRAERSYLQSYFAEYNDKLSDWLGRPLPWT